MNIRESLEHILQSDQPLGDKFYEIYFGRCPAAKEYFQDIDMKRQALVLTMALTLIEQYYTRGFKAVEQYLQHLGTKHADLHVPRELYPDWRDSMLICLEKCHGEEWSDGLATEWREAIDAVSEAMFRGYDKRVGN